MKVTYHGHSCFSVACGGKILLFDPFISANSLAASVDIGSIPADFILVSHGHFDHIADAVAIAKRTNALVIANFEVGTWLEKQGAPKVHTMNHGGGFDFPFGRATYVTAVHSSTMPDGSAGGNAGGFVIEAQEGSFYYSGDTALTYDMKLVAENHRPDFAVLCIGDNYTMGPQAACVAAEFTGVSRVMGVHYDTFPPIKIDHAKAREVFQRSGKSLFLPAIGETIEL